MFALQRCQQQAAIARQSALYLPHATWYSSDPSPFPTRISSRPLLNSQHQVLRSSTPPPHRFFCTSNTSASIQVHTWTPIALEVPRLRTRTVLTPWFSYTLDISPLLLRIVSLRQSFPSTADIRSFKFHADVFHFSVPLHLHRFHPRNVIMPMLLLSHRIGFFTFESQPFSTSISFRY